MFINKLVSRYNFEVGSLILFLLQIIVNSFSINIKNKKIYSPTTQLENYPVSISF